MNKTIQLKESFLCLLDVLGRVESDAIKGTLHRTDDVENFSERSVASVQKQNGILERKK